MYCCCKLDNHVETQAAPIKAEHTRNERLPFCQSPHSIRTASIPSVFGPLQFGFCHRHSTEIALHKVPNNLVIINKSNARSQCSFYWKTL